MAIRTAELKRRLKVADLVRANLDKLASFDEAFWVLDTVRGDIEDAKAAKEGKSRASEPATPPEGQPQ